MPKRKLKLPLRRPKSRQKRKPNTGFTLSADISGSFDVSKFQQITKEQYREHCIKLYGDKAGINIPDRCRCGETDCLCGAQEHYIYLMPKSGYNNLSHLVCEKSEINANRKEKYAKFKCDFSDMSKYYEVVKSVYKEYCVRLYGKNGTDIPDKCRCGFDGPKCTCNATDRYLYFIPKNPSAINDKIEPFVCDKCEAEGALKVKNHKKSSSTSNSELKSN